jgi:hypothetical protein
MPVDPSDRRPVCVAVVAVHGVGSPARFSTARAAADLLVQYQPNGATFGTFEERQLVIPVDPLLVAPSAPPAVTSARPAGRASIMAELAKDRSFVGRNREEPSPPDVAFMRGQLQDYVSEHEPFETAELVGERVDKSGARAAVHVFEMHWADLSRMGSGMLRVLGALYQLMLHISHLGRKTLDIGSQFAAEPEDQRLNESWQRFSDWHAAAIRLFAIGVPVAMLLMLVSAAFFIPAGVDADHRPVVGIIMAAIVVLGGVGTLFFTRLRAPRAAHVYAGLFLLVVGVGVWLGVRLPARAEALGTVALTASLGAMVAAAWTALLSVYDQSQPGSRRLARWGALVTAALTVVSVVRTPIDGRLEMAEKVRQAAFYAFQWGYVLFSITWIALWVVAFVTFLLGIRVWMLTESRPASKRLLRAAWTARVTLGFSLFGFSLAVLVGYETILSLAEQHTSYVDLLPRAQLQTVWSWFLPAPIGAAPDFFDALIAAGGTLALPHSMAGLAVALLMVAWFIGLVMLTSIRTPATDWPHTEQLGLWFTAGFRWLRGAGNLAASVILAGFIAGGIVAFAPAMFHFAWPAAVTQFFDPRWTTQMVHGIAYALLASAATLAAVQTRLAVIATQARPAIGIILDVDNYLRETPRTATPRAKITERYASLLRHITERKNPDGTPFFDRIVLVSHSQGTVITADFLRFLTEEKIASPAVNPSRFRLLTMGSPLRQLYAQHFPYLYGWIDAWEDAQPAPGGGALAAKSPDPANLRVGEWVNLYTSGDYVGRTLWRSEGAPGVWAREPFSAAAAAEHRRERCLGAGTHTHYWTSSDVAAEIDALMT